MTILAVLVLWGCTSDNENFRKRGEASMQVTLIDHPADYEAVLVEVIGFDYKLDTTFAEEMDDEDEMEEDSTEEESGSRFASDDEGSWTSVNVEPMIYDLLELNNGTEALLADFNLPTGEIEQVRLILGENNAVVVDGDTIALTTPSGQTSGVKLKIEEPIETGKNYKLVLDFDASKSVVEAGHVMDAENHKKYLLSPVIYAHLFEIEEEDLFGSVTGFVYPAPDSVSSIAYLIDGEEDTITTYPEEISGYFSFEGLETDTFNLAIIPTDSSGLSAIMVNDIIVGEAETVELDTLNF